MKKLGDYFSAMVTSQIPELKLKVDAEEVWIARAPWRKR